MRFFNGKILYNSWKNQNALTVNQNLIQMKNFQNILIEFMVIQAYQKEILENFKLISDFFFQIAGLKNLPRSGWKIKLNLKNSESVAEHSYMMSVMAMVLSDTKELNTEKILKMSILHDWAESKIGDFMPNEITTEKKTELEEYAMTEILDNLPEKIKDNYYDIWNDYKDNSSKEAKFVHELDKLEMALQGKIYEKENDPEKIKPFIISAVEQIVDDDLKKILIEIIQKTQIRLVGYIMNWQTKKMN